MNSYARGMLTPRISVVFTVFNGERHLDNAVRSVLAQTCTDFELIVVDDGSTDATPRLLAVWAAADARVRIVRQENRGLTASLNTGISVAIGTYIARHDADDVSMPERFARQASHLDAHASVAAVGSGAAVIDGTGATVGGLTAAVGPQAVRHGLLTLRTTPVHGSMMMRRDALLAVGGYREAFRVGQDYDLWLRLSERFDVDNLPEVLYQWRLDRDSVYTSRRTLQLKFAAIALAFARERADHGGDSYSELVASGGDLDAFVTHYRLGPFVHATWGELLLRGIGNSAGVRAHFRSALTGGDVRPWTLCLLAWTHLGLPWPGGRPLALPAEPGQP